MRGFLALASAQQAAQHAADDLIGDTANRAFRCGLHDTVAFTASRAGAAEQDIFQAAKQPVVFPALLALRRRSRLLPGGDLHPCCSISKADSRSTSSSYLPYSGEWFSRPLRSSSLTGPIREQGR